MKINVGGQNYDFNVVYTISTNNGLGVNINIKKLI